MPFFSIITKIFQFVKQEAEGYLQTTMGQSHITGFWAGDGEVQTSMKKSHIGRGMVDSAHHLRRRACDIVNYLTRLLIF